MTSSDHSWPPSNDERPDRGAGLAKAPDVVVELLAGVPLVALAAADERGAALGASAAGVELRRDVAADGDDAVHRLRRGGRDARNVIATP